MRAERPDARKGATTYQATTEGGVTYRLKRRNVYPWCAPKGSTVCHQELVTAKDDEECSSNPRPGSRSIEPHR